MRQFETGLDEELAEFGGGLDYLAGGCQKMTARDDFAAFVHDLPWYLPFGHFGVGWDGAGGGNDLSVILLLRLLT